MERSEFKNELLAYHADAPQRKMEVELALNGLFECLDTLAKYGHVLTVSKAQDSAYAGDEFPKIMYHDQHAPDGKVFHTESAVPTESGWRDTPQAPESEDDNRPDHQKGQGQTGQDQTGEGEGQQRRERDPNVIEPDKPQSQSGYPKKLYHQDHPGGISVMNADMERDYKERGWSDVEPKRDWVPPSSATDQERGGPGSIKPSNPAKRPDVKAQPKKDS